MHCLCFRARGAVSSFLRAHAALPRGTPGARVTMAIAGLNLTGLLPDERRLGVKGLGIL